MLLVAKNTDRLYPAHDGSIAVVVEQRVTANLLMQSVNDSVVIN